VMPALSLGVPWQRRGGKGEGRFRFLELRREGDSVKRERKEDDVPPRSVFLCDRRGEEEKRKRGRSKALTPRRYGYGRIGQREERGRRACDVGAEKKEEEPE